MGGLNERRAGAALVFALACCASYAGLRLWDAQSEPIMGTVTMQISIAYFWRLAITVMHGLGAAALAYWGLREEGASRLLRASPWLVPLVVLPSALAMLMVP